MTLPAARGCIALFLAATAGVSFLASGCSRLLPTRHGTADSSELVIDTRQDPSESLSGRIIPEVFPAVTKWPVIFRKSRPATAVFTDATCEIRDKSGDPLAVLKPVIEGNQVLLEISVPKADSVAEVHVVVHANYDYRW